jgi:hypothetical protein
MKNRGKHTAYIFLKQAFCNLFVEKLLQAVEKSQKK